MRRRNRTDLPGSPVDHRSRRLAAARWLVAVCVALGPAGAGAVPLHGAGPAGCPCDCADEEAPHAADHGAADDGADPCDEGCGDGCAECGCSPAPALAALTFGTPAVAAFHPATRAPGRRTAAPPGARTPVFRPPRG